MSEIITAPTAHRNELLSPEMNDLISYRPNWIIRKGNTVFFLVLLLLLAIIWWIRYPDILKGSVRLVAINAPKLLTAKTEGTLKKLLVTNEQQVQQGQALAYLQSTAKHEEVLVLQNWIGKVDTAVAKNRLEILLNEPLPLLYELGEVQPAYQAFQNSLQESLQLLSNGYYQQKKKALLVNLQYIAALQLTAERQKGLVQQDYDLQQIELHAKESLAKEKVIAPLELNQDKSKAIAKEQSLEQLTAQLINNTIVEQNKKMEILDLQKYITDQQQQFRSALLNLKSGIEEWKLRHIVEAPIAGKVLFVSFLQESQLININQELFYIQPPESYYYGELLVGQQGLGKIKTGQKTMIRVESFPSNEFGYLTGRVDYISHIPSRHDSFLIRVELPEGLHTNYDKKIFFRNNLAAQAEVITDHRRLIERFFSQLKRAADR